MVRKICRLGEKENPKKKYRGIFKNVIPIVPYGGGRIISIGTDDGEVHYLTAYFKTLIREEEKGIKLGDRIEIDYTDDENFTMEKLKGEEK